MWLRQVKFTFGAKNFSLLSYELSTQELRLCFYALSLVFTVLLKDTCVHERNILIDTGILSLQRIPFQRPPSHKSRHRAKHFPGLSASQQPQYFEIKGVIPNSQPAPNPIYTLLANLQVGFIRPLRRRLFHSPRSRLLGL